MKSLAVYFILTFAFVMACLGLSHGSIIVHEIPSTYYLQEDGSWKPEIPKGYTVFNKGIFKNEREVYLWNVGKDVVKCPDGYDEVNPFYAVAYTHPCYSKKDYIGKNRVTADPVWGYEAPDGEIHFFAHRLQEVKR